MSEITTSIAEQSSERTDTESRKAIARASDYFATEQFINEDGSLNRTSIPGFLSDCQIVFTADIEKVTEADVVHTFNLVTGLFEYLLYEGEDATAKSVFDYVNSNLSSICNYERIYNTEIVINLSKFLVYAVPNRSGDLSNESWNFISKLMERFASDELTVLPYLDGDIYNEGDFLLSFDLLLTNLLNTEGGDIRFANLVSTILARRYGFNQHKMLDTNRNTKRSAHARYSSSEAMNIFRIWGQCDGRGCPTLLEASTTDDAVTRDPTTEEVAVRRVQKVRRNFQVLEELKDSDSLKVARKLYRTNGITNFNRYSIKTLSEQYKIQMSSFTEILDSKLRFLTLLPYSDSNGAFESKHCVVNYANEKLHEIVIEAGTRREALVNILRSVEGTASRQRKNQSFYEIPFEYVYVAGHSNRKEVKLGNVDSEIRMQSSTIDIQLIEDPELYYWLYRHKLIDDSTVVILGGCNTAEDDEEDPTGDNLAKTIMKKLGVRDVVAAKTNTYGDQTPLIHADRTVTLTRPKNGRETNIVSIANELGRNLTYNR